MMVFCPQILVKIFILYGFQKFTKLDDNFLFAPNLSKKVILYGWKKFTNLYHDGILPQNLGKNNCTTWISKIHQFNWWFCIFPPNLSKSIQYHKDDDGILPQNLGKNNCTIWISKIHQFGWWFCILPPNFGKSMQYHKDFKNSLIWMMILYFTPKSW